MCVKIAHNRGFASRFLKAYFNSVKISIKKIKRNCFSFSPNSLDSSSLKHTGDIYIQISGKRGGVPQTRADTDTCSLIAIFLFLRLSHATRLPVATIIPVKTPLPTSSYTPFFARDEDRGHVLLLRETQAGDKYAVCERAAVEKSTSFVKDSERSTG